jgi:CRISPR/Cas system-associated exonuclease Cas4 (RecB family)
MPPVHFTVSQVRNAAACPRVLYFDAVRTRDDGLQQPSVSRLWKTGTGDETTACGSLFHAAVEQFNGKAARDDAVRQLLEADGEAGSLASQLLGHIYRNHVKRPSLFDKTAPQQEAFIEALKRYVTELAEILVHARACGRTTQEILAEMFGDKRRRVDVTFDVGPVGEAVHVTGALDYVFYDWRTAQNRIVDYKLTPADQPSNDLFQVCIYALMHHVQHRTRPDVGVLYLHPKREMVEKPWERVHAERHVVFNLLASMREWADYDEATGAGLKPPGEPLYCGGCRWNGECVRRLGPKHEGSRLSHWTPETDAGRRPEPAVDVREPAEASPELPRQELLLGRSVRGTSAVSLPLEALPTHVAVVGAAGSGKTWVAKVLVEEAVAQGIPVIAVDPQGDLVQFLKPRARAALPAELQPLYDRYWERVEPHIFTPGSSHGKRLRLTPVRLPGAEVIAASADEERRREEVDGLLASVAGNLAGLAKAGGDADCQRTFLLQVLRRLIVDVGSSPGLEALAEAAREPESLDIDADLYIKRTDREKLALKLQGLLAGTSANLFTGGTPLDLDTLLQPDRPGRVPLNVLYLNALTGDEQKQFFVATLATEVYRWMMTSGGRGVRVLFYVDEARDYAPAGAKKPPAKEPLLRLFAQGRKYGVACLLCTQSPRSVDFNVFGNCSTKIVGRLESAQDVERVAEWFTTDGVRPPWLNGRKGAEKGTFVARWPGQDAETQDMVWQSRCLFSAHEGAWSPERVAQEWGDA